MKKLALLISSALLVTACGGGGSGDGNSSTGGGSANLTKVTNDSARGMSGSAKTVDPAAARGVVNNFGSSGNQGVSQVAKAAFYGMRAASQSETYPCYQHNGKIVTTVEQQNDKSVVSLSIQRCSLSDDLNIFANGKFGMVAQDGTFTIDGNFVLRDENKAENLLVLNPLNFAFNSNTGIVFSSTITADSNTHNVTFTQSVISESSSNITTSLKIEGADSTWVEVVRIADASGTETSCEVTQSAGLSLTKEDGCSLLRL
ncbi:hypothetical protein VINI7043_12796 [Vibrio nigripulchritudo ATCC 27043]|uniref:hypothetical protein n=1 Tax=Vibrio nigripulchritudo TaxID=28173 RepID=UPI00021C3F26|nr:hypothetical protein [Vibrio nigripulchritudo]EGU52249.1 hypothetical protein VINI7043_12796 [Vibrio nigripulchritudo ATCC 27043]